jgi:hypothetical protein
LYQALLADAKFHEQLLAFDRDLAAQCRAAGCPECGGVLHVANYPRKPRGRPVALGAEHDRRFGVVQSWVTRAAGLTLPGLTMAR